MAATLQQPQHAPPTTGPNPQLKRLVYSKYREMLGSYNDKANTIIQALPAYMVREDKGFNFNVNNGENGHHEDLENGDCVDYGVPLPPSLPSNGSLPARRLQTQAPPEPPACVQNAMMTKDKKPFTYTPGGIDLSQIKSPRMAKRIARNAQYEGVTNQPKPSPLAQEQYNSGNSPPAAAPPPASAMGMPVQVFPTGPPPPPPQPAPSSNSNIPPPPPPMSSTQLTPQSNGRDTRKSPTPQNFEPPPLGCRPEIKIPPNPMATLRKVPKPEPKNDFWVEEYRKERSKSPLPGESTEQEQSANQSVRQDASPSVASPKPTSTISTNNLENDSDPRKDPNRIAFQQQQQQPVRPQPQQYQPPQQQPQQHQPQQYQPQQTYQPQPPRPIQPVYQQQQKQSEPSYPPHMDPNRIAFQQQRQQPPQQQQQQQKREVSPVRTPGGYYQQQQPQRPQPSGISQNSQRPTSPVKSMNSPPMQQQQQSPYYARPQQQQPSYQTPQPQQQQQPRQYVTSPPPQQKPAQVGSLYIAPVPPENLATGSETPRTAGLQQTPPWLAQRPNMKENPDWIREVNSPPTVNRTQTPPINQNQVNNGPGLRLQMNQNVTQSNAKERIIPIQIEKTPTPSRTPSTPGFGPQPYSPNNQFGSVTSPGSGYSSPNVNQVRSPNQFVDQGYNNFPNQWQNQQQRVVSPPVQQQQGGGRIVPIALERDEGPFNPNVVRGPISPAPMVIQNDPRGGPQSRSPNGMTPNQSKSFRVLQKITDTDIDRDSDSEQPVELHGPQYSKQMGDTTDQMKRMQMNDSNQQAFVNRADPRYRGATVPSKTFQKLKSMTDKVAEAQKSKQNTTAIRQIKDNQDEVQNMNWGPIQRQTQRYVQQRPIYQQDDQQQQQQYVHPSEQQAPEPKIYTGSAIPSRSFKLLQAMTTPENAVEMDDSRVVQNEPVNCSPRYNGPEFFQRLTSVTPPPYPLFNPNDLEESSSKDFPSYKPYAYYYPQFDIQAFGDFENGFIQHSDADVKAIDGAPDIVITASPEDDEEPVKYDDVTRILQNTSGEYVNVKEEEPEDDKTGGDEDFDFWAERERDLKFSRRAETPIDLLSKRLSELGWSTGSEETSKTGPISFFSEKDDGLNISKLPNDLTNNLSENGVKSAEESDDESEDLLTSSSSEEEECAKNKVNSSRDGLHAIRSVTDIKVYANEDLDEQNGLVDKDEFAQNGGLTAPVNTSVWESRENEDPPSYDHYREEEQDRQYVEYGSDTDDDGADDLEHEDIEIRDHLSVIYEEDGTESAYSPRKIRTDSINSTSSTLSDCSTTIANDDQEEEEEEVEEEHEEYGDETKTDDENYVKGKEEEEEDNSVTVRLPLKLSFSRSSNDENITTVVVGDSEIQDSRRSSLKTNDDDSGFNSKNSNHQQDEDEDHAADVSVTFSLTSRSNSMNRSGLLSKTPSVEHETSNKDWDDSDSDSVSIAVSLPMKRNKFMTQTLNNDVTNDIHEMKPNWDVNEADNYGDDQQNDVRNDDETLKECIPETIPEEEEQEIEEEIEEEVENESSEDEGKVDVKALINEINLRTKTEYDPEKINRRHSSGDSNMRPSLNSKSRDLKTHTSYTEIPRATPDIFEALRELRIWNEKAIKRATEERELEQKIEKPILKKDISLDQIGNYNSFLNTLKTEETNDATLYTEVQDVSDEETEESTSESTTSSEQDYSPPEPKNISSNLRPSFSTKKLNPLYESLSFVLEETQRKCEETLRSKQEREIENAKLSVRERIAVFEAVKEVSERPKTPKPLIEIPVSSPSTLIREVFSRNSSTHRSESEQEEDDSGVTSDMSKPVSENDTDPECFTELRKMSRYQRAATHSRLFKLLQDESFEEDEKEKVEEEPPKVVLRPKKKIIHNVSITRRSNPEALIEAETMFQRRQRLSLPLKFGNSIDADNPSTSNSPSSPALKNTVTDQLISELIQSLLLKNDSEHLRSIPWEKLQAAAKKVLQEGLDVDSLENTSIESTPALTPQDTKKEYQKSYADYYDSWDRTGSPKTIADSIGSDIVPSRTFRNLHNQSPMPGQNKFRPIRCPRVLSSKTINRDLSRLTESRESESPDRYTSPRSSATPDITREHLRATSVSRIGKV